MGKYLSNFNKKIILGAVHISRDREGGTFFLNRQKSVTTWSRQGTGFFLKNVHISHVGGGGSLISFFRGGELLIYFSRFKHREIFWPVAGSK